MFFSCNITATFWKQYYVFIRSDDCEGGRWKKEKKGELVGWLNPISLGECEQ